METTQYTFWSLINQFQIEIPIIQRDYAQGRETYKITEIRNNFLNNLYYAINKSEHLDFDFVYGSIENYKFVPLDGQQRLTTLFLLHWYLALKDGKLEDVKDILSKFRYETRTSSSEFCNKLTCSGLVFSANEAEKTVISAKIKDANWFFSAWEKDPTINSMLVMLDAIEVKFEECTGLFTKLIEEKSITFQFIELNNFGLSDSLYIKINARGKVLTDFENFKAKFEQFLGNQLAGGKISGYFNHDSGNNITYQEYFSRKIDGEWTDLFWKYRYNDHEIDNRFMRYFYFITELLYYKMLEKEESNSPFRYDNDKNPQLNFELIEKTYELKENLDFLFRSLDYLHSLADTSAYFNSIFSDVDYAVDKIRLFDIKTDLFLQCVKNESFGLKERIILYTTIEYSIKYGKDVPLKGLIDTVRVVRNLLFNSELEYRFLHNQLKSLNYLIVDDVYFALKENLTLTGFNQQQRTEEQLKARLILLNGQNAVSIRRAEELVELKGNIQCLFNEVFNINISDAANFALEQFDQNKMNQLIDAYISLTEGNGKLILGDLIPTDAFNHLEWRVELKSDYLKNAGLLKLVGEKAKGKNRGLMLTEFAEKIERKFVTDLVKKYQDLSNVKKASDQLYLYYIFTKRIQRKSHLVFFKNGYNFGWLPSKVGYSSYFKAGLGNHHYKDHNPIFQVYKTQFRYNRGLKKEYALDLEVVGSSRPRNLFDKLIEWALTNQN